MEIDQYLSLMKFPSEWIDLGMYPDELWELQRRGYEFGHELSPEHDRNGAFHWWLKKSMTREQILNLVRLCYLDPDQIMASDVRRYIKKHSSVDNLVLTEIEKLEIQVHRSQ